MVLFKQENINIIEEKIGWQSAIKLAAQPLKDNGYIELKYIDAMIEIVNRLGSYIVIAPHVAIAHARPENGVNKIGLSLLKNNVPIDFNLDKKEMFDEEKEVHIIIVLAAVDNNEHLGLLQQLSKVIDDNKKIEEIIKADNAIDLSTVIDKYINS